MIHWECPACGGNDAIQRVGAVVGSQTSDTSGMALTYVGGDHGILGVAPSVYGGVNASRLAQRLSPYTMRPGNIHPFWIYSSWLLGSVGCAMWLNNRFSPHVGDGLMTTFLWMAAGIPIAGLTVFLLHLMHEFEQRHARRLWHTQWAYLNDCYYCFRDDIVFDVTHHGRPEDFVPHVFSLSYEEMGYEE